MKKPKIITLELDGFERLAQCALNGYLCAEDGEMVAHICRGYPWLKALLRESALTIKRLRDLLSMNGKQSDATLNRLIKVLTLTLGQTNQKDEEAQTDEGALATPTDSSSHIEHEQTNQVPEQALKAANTNETETASADDHEKKKKRRGHGRHKHQAYTHAMTVCHTHEHLSAGDTCPKCGFGKMYIMPPSVIVTFSGGPLITATRHMFNRLRCARCGYIDKVLPASGFTKYSPSCLATLAIFRYYGALPFFRLARLQKLAGAPLAASTQWDAMVLMFNAVLPVFLALFRLAANAGLIHYDDTWVRILSLMHENKLFERDERKGMFTTGILAKINVSADLSPFIVLFLSGRKHAGENMNELLKDRTVDDALMMMSDASTSNLVDWLIAVVCKCLCHALRKFAEIESFYSEECGVVLGFLKIVYQNEAIIKKEKMTDHERLVYHQKNSKGPMDQLKCYLETQIYEKKVEPNSSLGKAIAYTLKHWHGLIRFLEVEGAPLDNNSMEQALKVQIKARKNSLFYKTEFGAFVGSVLTSVIATCERNATNPFHYLETLATHETAVSKNPESWLPWNYQEALLTVQLKKTPLWANAPPRSQAA